MFREITQSSKTRRNFFSFRTFAVLGVGLLALGLPRTAAAATCADAFANWSSGSRLVHNITGTSTYGHEIDEWDSDPIKIRHNIAGVLVLGAKGVAILGTLYVWDEVNEEADVVGTMALGGGSGATYTTAVDVGDYCLEVSDDDSEGYFELNLNFLDGCTLGTLPSSYCNTGGE